MNNNARLLGHCGVPSIYISIIYYFLALKGLVFDLHNI